MSRPTGVQDLLLSPILPNFLGTIPHLKSLTIIGIFPAFYFLSGRPGLLALLKLDVYRPSLLRDMIFPIWQNPYAMILYACRALWGIENDGGT